MRAAQQVYSKIRGMAVASQLVYSKLQQYKPPSWASKLAYQPTEYVQLAMRPTPIHKWELPGVPSGFEVFVKRDDMTGSTLGGNKIRKLEFLLADAVQQGCDSVITCGGIQSNHCRATALASRQLGLNPHLVLRCPGENDPSAVPTTGNVMLDRLAGAKIILAPPLNYDFDSGMRKGLKDIMQEHAEKLRSEGHVPYLIPVGGSNYIGTWGYIEAFKEMIEQGVMDNFDDIVMAVGSGGTATGIAIANYLTGSKLKVHAVCVCDDAEAFYKHTSEELVAYGLTVGEQGSPLNSRDILDLIEGYKGEGYGKTTSSDLSQLIEVFSQTGVSLDPVYTLKGVQGMLGELNSNPGRFAGKRILYIHTGGIFGLYDGRIDRLLKETHCTNQIDSYLDRF